ncbi:MAG: GlcNAc-PI de-N-acetylase [Acidimicrobiales bacterium]|nr:MAG: GlcNAc-PI de-N-acetylase [Acidimicrobiales bacterium]
MGLSHNLRTPRTVLAVGAHPDDVEFGCGGTLAKWASAGAEVTIAVITDGSIGTWDPGRDPDALREQRRREAERAAEVLGCKGGVVFLGAPDGFLEANRTLRRELCRVIRDVRPEVVLGHDPWRTDRLHPDHRHAGFLTLDAVCIAREPAAEPELGEAHRAGIVLLFETDRPDHIEDVTGHEQTKARALECHESQFVSTMQITDPSDHEELERFRRRVDRELSDIGGRFGFVRAEAFRAIREV